MQGSVFRPGAGNSLWQGKGVSPIIVYQNMRSKSSILIQNRGLDSGKLILHEIGMMPEKV